MHGHKKTKLTNTEHTKEAAGSQPKNPKIQGSCALMINVHFSETKLFPEFRLSMSELPECVGLPEKLGDAPLRLIIVGHNPSEHAWKSGHYYSNPSNRYFLISYVVCSFGNALYMPES